MKLHIITKRKNSPLLLKDRLVWSLILFINRHKKAASSYKIRKLSGMNSQTVAKSIKQLLSFNLIVKRDFKIIALEPNGDCVDWFVWRDAKTWTKRLNYSVMDLDSPLPMAANCLYWLLVSLDKSNQKKGKLNTASKSNLAKMLGVTRQTVVRGLERLVKDDLIALDVIKRGDVIKGITFSILEKVEPKQESVPVIKPEERIEPMEKPADNVDFLIEGEQEAPASSKELAEETLTMLNNAIPAKVKAYGLVAAKLWWQREGPKLKANYDDKDAVAIQEAYAILGHNER